MIRKVTVLKNVKEYSRRSSKFSDAHCKEKNKVGQSIFVFENMIFLPGKEMTNNRSV